MTQALVRNTTWSDGDTLTAADLNAEFDQDLEAAAVATANITDAAVTTAKILDANVTTAKIADSNVTTAKIADANVTTAKILDANVTTAKIADSNVTTAKIADANVTTAKILDANVTADKLATNSVTTAKITDANVTTAKILDANVTTAKIADANVTEGKLSAGLKAKMLLQDQSLTLDNGVKLTLNTSTAITADGDVATKKYADDLAIAGSPDSTTAVKGLVLMSTAPVSAASPIAVGDNDARITAVAGKASLALNNLASTALNADIIPATDNVRTLGSNAYKYADVKSYKLNGVSRTELINDTLLDSTYFPDTTTLYGWNAFAQGTLANADWIGTEALTDVGTITYDADHLGTANNAIVLNGTDQCVHATGTTFDDTGSFTVGMWLKKDTSGTNQTLVGKYTVAGGAANSFLVYVAGSSVSFILYYDSSNNNVTLPLWVNNILFDNEWHHFVGVYNQESTSMTGYLDGVVVGHTVDANLAARNNSASADLTFGAIDGSGTPSLFWDGSMADMFYKKAALTPDQVRKIYAASASVHGSVATEGVKGQVKIDGRQPVNIAISPSNVASLNSTSIADITGFAVYIPEAGSYLGTIMTSLEVNDDNSDDEVLGSTYIYNGTTQLVTSAFGYRSLNTVGEIRYPVIIQTKGYVSMAKDSVMKASYVIANAADSVDYNNNVISITKDM